VIAAQPGQVEVEPKPLGKSQQLDEAVQRPGVRLLWADHELAKLQVNPDDVGPQLLHLAEVSLDSGPLVLPIVFDQPTLGVMIVVETPGSEWLARSVENKGRVVLTYLDERSVVGRGTSALW